MKYIFTEEHKRNISIAAKNRPPVKDSTREKMRLINTGRTHENWPPISDRTRERLTAQLREMGNKRRGTPLSEEVKRNVSESLKGERNPRWRGGITDATKKIRHSREGRIWREAVLGRDGNKCTRCGVNEGFMEAHHIKEFYHHPEKRFDVDNGTTLCNACHIKQHKDRVEGA